MQHQIVKPKVLFVLNHEKVFQIHRYDFAMALLRAGFEVAVATPNDSVSERLGPFKRFNYKLDRKSMNPLRELVTLYSLWQIYRAYKPDVVHHFAIKAVLYGSLIARLVKLPVIINTITGLGFLFISRRPAVRLVRRMLSPIFRFALNQPNLITTFENPDDQKLFVNCGFIEADRTRVINGCGVDVQKYLPFPEPEGTPVILFPGRLLKDKGVEFLIEAGKILAHLGENFKLRLVGPLDPDNPSHISETQIRIWLKQHNWLEWMGAQKEMAKIYADAHIICLPSFGEGLPMALIEAAASGRPIVTTDVNGCRELVRDNNGLLVPARNSVALASALQTMINTPSLRQEMGLRGRRMVEQNLSQNVIFEDFISQYRSLLFPETILANPNGVFRSPPVAAVKHTTQPEVAHQ